MNDFKQLITAIEQVRQRLQAQAAGAVNRALTLRNWLIGYYLVEFEQKGHERATYGLQLLEKIAATVNINGIFATNLKLFRQFYLACPKLSQTVSDQLQPLLPAIQNNQPSGTPVTVSSEKIISRLSFSHLIENLFIQKYLIRLPNKEQLEDHIKEELKKLQ